MNNDLKTRILKDIKVELSDEFDRNFSRKSFFGDPWEVRMRKYPRGSLMVISNRLRRSFRGVISQSGVRWTSDAPYASLHNQGGKIKITRKMRGYFWAQYYRCLGEQKTTKSGQPSKSKKNIELGAEALFWRNMALHRGHTITIPKRQVIGNHRKVEALVKDIANTAVRDHIQKNITNKLTKK